MTEEEFSAALAELESVPQRVRSLVADLPAAALVRRPSPDAFSILENVWHLRDIEAEGHLVRIRRVVAEVEPVLPDLDGAALARDRRYNERDLASGLEGLGSARFASVAALRLAGIGALARAGHLETVGRTTLGGIIARMLEHDRDHLQEMGMLRRASQSGR